MKNLGTIERVLRVALSGALAIWAMLLLGCGGLVWWLAYVALIALKVDIVVIGIERLCPRPTSMALRPRRGERNRCSRRHPDPQDLDQATFWSDPDRRGGAARMTLRADAKTIAKFLARRLGSRMTAFRGLAGALRRPGGYAKDARALQPICPSGSTARLHRAKDLDDDFDAALQRSFVLSHRSLGKREAMSEAEVRVSRLFESKQAWSLG